MYGDSHHAHAYPFAEQEHYLHQRRRRRTGLYQFMTPDRYIPGQEIYLHDIILALKEHTTSTGLPHIHHSRGPIKKGWWILITLGAIGGLIFNLYQLGTSYFDYDVNVAINMLHRSELNFPSITICNLNPVRQSAMLSRSNPDGNATPTSGPKLRRKRAADTDTSTAPPATGQSSSPMADDKCCCSCCFSSSVVAKINDYCSCNASVYPYDPATCQSSPLSLSSSSAVRATTTLLPNPATTAQPPPSTLEITTSLPPDTTTTMMKTTTTAVRESTTKVPTTTTIISTTPEADDDDTSDDQEEDLIEMLAALPLEEKVALGFSVHDIVLDCKFEGTGCDTSYFASFFNEILGNCYIFNSAWTNFTKISKSKKTGRRHGLHIVLNVNQDEYLSIGDDTAGIRLVVSNQLRMPFPEDEGLALNPGQSTSIGLRQVTMMRLPEPYGSCVDPTISNKERNVYEELHPGVQYSTLGCMRTCYQANVISTCGCGDAAFPLMGSAFGFPASDGVAVQPCSHRNQTQKSCKEEISAKYNQNDLNCDCPDSCSDTEFTTTLSIGQWPSNVQKDDILNTLSNLVTFSLNDSTGYKENLIKVEIFFEEFDFELMQEVPAYQLSKFISDIGGVLGLWLGMSVLTACEFFEFGLDITLFGIGQFIQYKKRNKSSSVVQKVNVWPQRQQHPAPLAERPATSSSIVSQGQQHPTPLTERPATSSSIGSQGQQHVSPLTERPATSSSIVSQGQQHPTPLTERPATSSSIGSQGQQHVSPLTERPATSSSVGIGSVSQDMEMSEVA